MRLIIASLIFFNLISFVKADLCKVSWMDGSFDDIISKVEYSCKRNQLIQLNSVGVLTGEPSMQYLATSLCRFDREILNTNSSLICILK